MDQRLLDILCCPVTRQPLAPLSARQLEALNRAIGEGRVVRADGSPQSSPLTAALITRDRRTVYRIDDGIPVLLADEGINTTQITDFPG
ncbi:MAG: Trm112 family protein [Rehaibacterium terrae]|uniref:Trm112 family protein n=1 Tax=Rehaibacterium terrae TaxID=1341696 RepID=UPI00391AA702